MFCFRLFMHTQKIHHFLVYNSYKRGIQIKLAIVYSHVIACLNMLHVHLMLLPSLWYKLRFLKIDILIMPNFNDNRKEQHHMTDFQSKKSFELNGKKYNYYDLKAIEEAKLGKVNRLPFSIRILLESVIRQ